MDYIKWYRLLEQQFPDCWWHISCIWKQQHWVNTNVLFMSSASFYFLVNSVLWYHPNTLFPSASVSRWLLLSFSARITVDRRPAPGWWKMEKKHTIALNKTDQMWLFFFPCVSDVIVYLNKLSRQLSVLNALVYTWISFRLSWVKKSTILQKKKLFSIEGAYHSSIENQNIWSSLFRLATPQKLFSWFWTVGLKPYCITPLCCLKIIAFHLFQDILGLGHTASSRSKRSLLVPPMIVTENQRAPFPRIIGRVRNTYDAQSKYNHGWLYSVRKLKI